MTKFLERSFSVAVGSPEFQSGWNTIFGRGSKIEEMLQGPPLEILPRLLAECPIQDASAQAVWLAEHYDQTTLRRAYDALHHVLIPLEQRRDVDGAYVDKIRHALDRLWLAFDNESKHARDRGLDPHL